VQLTGEQRQASKQHQGETDGKENKGRSDATNK
jgi:hypothetical protein